MSKRVLWTILVGLEVLYICVSTWASIVFRYDPWTAELIRTAARALSLTAYFVLARTLPVPAATPGARGRRLWLWVGLVAILLYPLFLQKGNFSGGLTVLWFFSSFLVGFREEFFYRRLVQNELESRWGRPAGILVTSAAFTLYHLYFFVLGYWTGVAEVFLWSLAIGLVYSATRSFLLVALFHGLYDALPMVTPFLLPIPVQWGLCFLVLGMVFAFWGAKRRTS